MIRDWKSKGDGDTATDSMQSMDLAQHEIQTSLNTQTRSGIGGILRFNEKPIDVVLKYVSSRLRDLYNTLTLIMK